MKQKQEMEVKAKQYWRRKSTGKQVRVLGVVEGYVVARVKGCGPFLYGWKDFEKDFDRLHIADGMTQNALAQGRAACGESLGAGGSAANDKEKANA